MPDDKMRVRGLVSCAGEWGALGEGEEMDLPPAVAESLLRAGYAEPVEESPAVEKKDETQPRRRSKRVSAS